MRTAQEDADEDEGQNGALSPAEEVQDIALSSEEARAEPSVAHTFTTLSSEEVLRAGSLSSEEVSLSALSSEAARSRSGHCVTIDAAFAPLYLYTGSRRQRTSQPNASYTKIVRRYP